MNIKKIIIMLLAFILLWCGTMASAFAESRNIYVGDIITLEITSEFSQEELQEKFKDFEIIEIKSESYGYLISLRTFNVGEYIILLGDKEVVITVTSTLDDIQREGIFEGEEGIIKSIFFFQWSIIFYIITGVFFVVGSFIIAKTFIKRKVKIKTPYQLFLKGANSLSKEDDNYFVSLTLYFKEYLERRYNCQIIGKTSAEIINELKKIQQLSPMILDIQKWLIECDRFKFTDIGVSSEEKHNHYMELLNIGDRINKMEVNGYS